MALLPPRQQQEAPVAAIAGKPPALRITPSASRARGAHRPTPARAGRIAGVRIAAGYGTARALRRAN